MLHQFGKWHRSFIFLKLLSPLRNRFLVKCSHYQNWYFPKVQRKDVVNELFVFYLYLSWVRVGNLGRKAHIKVLLNLFSNTSSKLLAKLNLEKGLYSKDKTECFLKGKTNLSRSLSLNFITRTLLEFLWSEFWWFTFKA